MFWFDHFYNVKCNVYNTTLSIVHINDILVINDNTILLTQTRKYQHDIQICFYPHILFPISIERYDSKDIEDDMNFYEGAAILNCRISYNNPNLEDVNLNVTFHAIGRSRRHFHCPKIEKAPITSSLRDQRNSSFGLLSNRPFQSHV